MVTVDSSRLLHDMPRANRSLKVEIYGLQQTKVVKMGVNRAFPDSAGQQTRYQTK